MEMSKKQRPPRENPLLARQANMIRRERDVGELKKHSSGTDSQFISAASVLLRRSSRFLPWRQNDDYLFAAAAFSVAVAAIFVGKMGRQLLLLSVGEEPDI